MPKPRMQKRTALDVVLGQPAPEISSTETEDGTSGASMSLVPVVTAENGADQEDDAGEGAGESESEARVASVGSELDTESRAAVFGSEVSDNEREDEQVKSVPPAVAMLPAAVAPASNGTRSGTSRQSRPAVSPEQTDPRFEPVLGRNDDAALVPFSTRLSPELRRRLKLYSAVSGESTTSLTNRALDYMLEVAERKVGLR
ncbi:hypothetical protein [Cellulosimicrobium sp. Marseille-Q8652]